MGKIRTNHGIEHWSGKTFQKMKQPKGMETGSIPVLLRNKVGKTETNHGGSHYPEYVEEGRKNKEKNRRSKSELKENPLRDSKKQGQFESGGVQMLNKHLLTE